MRRSFCPLSGNSVAHNATTAARLNAHAHNAAALTVAVAAVPAHIIALAGNVRVTVQNQVKSITGGGNMALGAKIWLAVLAQAPQQSLEAIFAFLLNCAATGPGYATMGRLIHEQADAQAKNMLGYLFRGHLTQINGNGALGQHWMTQRLHGNNYLPTAEFIPAVNAALAIDCQTWLKNMFVDYMVLANFANQAGLDEGMKAFHAFPIMSTKGSQVLGSLIYTHWFLQQVEDAETAGHGLAALQTALNLIVQTDRFQAGQGLRTTTLQAAGYAVPVINHLVYFPEIMTSYVNTPPDLRVKLCQFSVTAQVKHFEMHRDAYAQGRIQGQADVGSNIITHCSKKVNDADAGIALMAAVAIACFAGQPPGNAQVACAQGELPHAFCRHFMTNDKAGAVAIALVGEFLANQGLGECGGN